MRYRGHSKLQWIAQTLLGLQRSRRELLALLGDVLSAHIGAEYNAALRLRLIDKKISWQALIEFAEKQGVLWPFIWALQRRALLLPAPSAEPADPDHPTVQLMSAYREYLARRERQRDQLCTILSALNRAGIQPLLLKGARHLVAAPGPWAEARDMRDLDLLVRPEQTALATATLDSLGYAPDSAGAPLDQHLPEMWQAGSPSVVEIHIHALAFSARQILSTDEMWRRAVPMSMPRANFFVMPIEWHVLHSILSHEIADRSYVRRILAAKPLWELTMIAAAMTSEHWRLIAKHLADCGEADVLGSVITQAEKLYGMRRPEGIAISPAAQAHAAATLKNAASPNWLQLVRIIPDELRFGFSKETLAVRYNIDKQDVSLATKLRHLKFLRRYYRGRISNRLFGSRSPP